MLRWSLLSLALVFLALGLLTVFRSPDWSIWQLALLAGEFGHWLALGAAAVAIGALITRGSAGVLAPVTPIVALVATALLLKPAINAVAVADLARIDLDLLHASRAP